MLTRGRLSWLLPYVEHSITIPYSTGTTPYHVTYHSEALV